MGGALFSLGLLAFARRSSLLRSSGIQRFRDANLPAKHVDKLIGRGKYQAREGALLFSQTKLHQTVRMLDAAHDPQWLDWETMFESDDAKVYKFVPCFRRHNGVCMTVDSLRLKLYNKFIKLFKGRVQSLPSYGLGQVHLVGFFHTGGDCIVGFSVVFKLKPSIVCFLPLRRRGAAGPALGATDDVSAIKCDAIVFDALPADFELVPRAARFPDGRTATELTVWMPHRFAKQVLSLGDSADITFKRMSNDLVDSMDDNSLIIRVMSAHVVADAPAAAKAKAKPAKQDAETAFSEMLDAAFNEMHQGNDTPPASPGGASTELFGKTARGIHKVIIALHLPGLRKNIVFRHATQSSSPLCPTVIIASALQSPHSFPNAELKTSVEHILAQIQRAVRAMPWSRFNCSYCVCLIMVLLRILMYYSV
jgi:hypothetical protein